LTSSAGTKGLLMGLGLGAPVDQVCTVTLSPATPLCLVSVTHGDDAIF